jgi:hypothetical protein
MVAWWASSSDYAPRTPLSASLQQCTPATARPRSLACLVEPLSEVLRVPHDRVAVLCRLRRGLRLRRLLRGLAGCTLLRRRGRGRGGLGLSARPRRCGDLRADAIAVSATNPGRPGLPTVRALPGGAAMSSAAPVLVSATEKEWIMCTSARRQATSSQEPSSALQRTVAGDGVGREAEEVAGGEDDFLNHQAALRLGGESRGGRRRSTRAGTQACLETAAIGHVKVHLERLARALVRHAAQGTHAVRASASKGRQEELSPRGDGLGPVAVVSDTARELLPDACARTAPTSAPRSSNPEQAERTVVCVVVLGVAVVEVRGHGRVIVLGAGGQSAGLPGQGRAGQRSGHFPPTSPRSRAHAAASQIASAPGCDGWRSRPAARLRRRRAHVAVVVLGIKDHSETSEQVLIAEHGALIAGGFGEPARQPHPGRYALRRSAQRESAVDGAEAGASPRARTPERKSVVAFTAAAVHGELEGGLPRRHAVRLGRGDTDPVRPGRRAERMRAHAAK